MKVAKNLMFSNIKDAITQSPDFVFMKAVNNIRREYVLSPSRKSSEDGLKFSVVDAMRVNADVKRY